MFLDMMFSLHDDDDDDVIQYSCLLVHLLGFDVEVGVFAECESFSV